MDSTSVLSWDPQSIDSQQYVRHFRTYDNSHGTCVCMRARVWIVPSDKIHQVRETEDQLGRVLHVASAIK